MNYFKQFCVKPNARIRLDKIDPDDTYGLSHADADRICRHNAERISAFQELLYAERKRSALVCLRAMDTGGKDGTVSHVLAAMNPQGCKATTFKKPTPIELAHDFLWRIHQATPAMGEVAIFNRSHYEDVLTVRVHKLVPEKTWRRRYEQINAFENMLGDNGTHILKFYLHISKDEQLRRFKDRLDDPSRQWKISDADYTERTYWDDYMRTYEDMLSQCSTAAAPWFIIPANHKWFRNAAVSQIMVEYFERLGMKPPAPTVDIAHIRKEYRNAKREA